MTRPMLALGLLWMLTSGVALAQEDSDASAKTGVVRAPSVDMAQDLARAGRTDEAIAVLMRLADDDEAGSQAGARLRTLLLTEAPRRAWADAYAVALRTAPTDQRHELQVRAARADLQDASTRDAALRRLQRLLDERSGDLEARLAVGDALLEMGRFEDALRVYGSREGAAILKGRVAGLIASDQLGEAEKIGPALIPASCASARTPTACAVGLREMGYPGAAAASLRQALTQGHKDLRSRTGQAGAWSTVATIEESRGELVLALQAWRRAAALDGDNRIIKDRLGQLLATTGRPEEAARVVGTSDPKVTGSIEAVRLATSVDPEKKSDAVDAAIARARELDPNHPLVAQAYAHWLLARDRPDEALRALTPFLDSRVGNSNYLNLYVWAASQAEQPELAADALQNSLARIEDPQGWHDRFAKLSNLQTVAAERAKDRSDLDEAEARYRMAQTADPTSIRVLVGLGGVLWKAGKLAEAEEVYDEALRLAPGNRTALFAVVELHRLRGDEAGAQALLARSGYDDLKVRRLEAELAVMAEADGARRLRQSGQLSAALAEYARLVEKHPGQPALLHAYADTLAEGGRLVEAAETYAKARELDPENPWITLGEIGALAALAQPEEARRLYATLPREPDDDLARAMHRALRGIERVEAERFLAEGRDDAAMAIFQSWVADSADVESCIAIGDLYLARWQNGAAAAWYQAAIGQDPTSADAQRGLVRADIGRGRIADAEKRVSELVKRDPSPANVQLARTVARRSALDRAISAAASGDHAAAERILLEQISLWPSDLDLRVAHARLLLLRDEPEVALREIQGVLAVEPTHAEALAALQTAALTLGQADVALAAYEVALSNGAPAWVKEEVGSLRLASRLDKARAQHKVGPHEAAVTTIEQATAYYGDNDARRWSQIGGGWLDIGEPKRAMEAFEMARRLDPANPGAVIGMAGSWETLGQPARAEAVLTAHWDAHHNPNVGVALVELHRRRGQPEAARKVLVELQEASGDADVVVFSEATPPRPLPVVAPSGVSIDEGTGGRSADQPGWGAVDIASLQANDRQGLGVQVAAGGGWLGRPGNAGEQFLNILYLPLAAGVDLPGPVDLQAEVVGVQLTDGLRESGGASMSAALVTGLPGGWGAQARIGRDNVVSAGFGALTTWYLGANATLGGGLSGEVQAGRAPVTDTLASWAGSYSATGQPFGRVWDTWVGAGLTYAFDPNTLVGVLGRAGHADGLGGMGEVPWRQVLAYGRMPLRSETRNASWISFEGILLDHDRQVDGFAPGQGGMFTPDLFATVQARLEALWVPPSGRWSACGLAGAGPQIVQGDQTLYLYPGTYVGYQLQGTVQTELGRDWTLMAHGMHAGSFGAWGQTGVFAQLRYGSAAQLGSPSPIFGSLIHGPPLAQPQPCPEPLQEVTK